MTGLPEIREIPPFYAVLGVIFASLFFTLIRSKAYHLGHLPGPFLSRYTDAYRAYLAWKYSGQDVNLYMKVHSAYGNVVRIGPRSVSVLDPAAIPFIYGVKARFNKVTFTIENYSVHQKLTGVL